MQEAIFRSDVWSTSAALIAVVLEVLVLRRSLLLLFRMRTLQQSLPAAHCDGAVFSSATAAVAASRAAIRRRRTRTVPGLITVGLMRRSLIVRGANAGAAPTLRRQRPGPGTFWGRDRGLGRGEERGCRCSDVSRGLLPCRLVVQLRAAAGESGGDGHAGAATPVRFLEQVV